MRKAREALHSMVDIINISECHHQDISGLVTLWILLEFPSLPYRALYSQAPSLGVSKMTSRQACVWIEAQYRRSLPGVMRNLSEQVQHSVPSISACSYGYMHNATAVPFMSS